MWCRFLTFCLLVSLILVIVLSYIHGRPVVHLFFKRCCDEDIENDEVIFENFANNYLRERLVAIDVVVDNGTFVPSDVDIDEIMEVMREKLNVHDPKARERLAELENEIMVDNLNITESINDVASIDVFEMANDELLTAVTSEDSDVSTTGKPINNATTSIISTEDI